MPFLKPLRIPLKAVSAIGITATLLAGAGAGANWLFTKETPDGESAARNVFCEKSASGSGMCLRETGAINASGGGIFGAAISGSTLHTLTGITLGDSDGAGCSTIYVLNGVVTAATDDCP